MVRYHLYKRNPPREHDTQYTRRLVGHDSSVDCRPTCHCQQSTVTVESHFAALRLRSESRDCLSRLETQHTFISKQSERCPTRPGSCASNRDVPNCRCGCANPRTRIHHSIRDIDKWHATASHATLRHCTLPSHVPGHRRGHRAVQAAIRGIQSDDSVHNNLSHALQITRPVRPDASTEQVRTPGT